MLRYKVFEPILLLGRERFANMDIRIRVKGGGYTSQIYAIRQAIAKSVVAYYQKYVDEASKREIRDILVTYDRTLLVADPRRCEPKKFGGPGARARRQSPTVKRRSFVGSSIIGVCLCKYIPSDGRVIRSPHVANHRIERHAQAENGDYQLTPKRCHPGRKSNGKPP